ncbi:MAG TPA: GH3 auxin-responsive promoter family protein, partial [Chitinophagaceae bacterium]|nr:GH3 auxin-responsive promoter family protein [Chitinophagaceae bacterium]
VSGRIKHFISAFGEHVIGEEVEFALLSVAKQMNVSVVEFTVAPSNAQDKGKSYHEWFIEFENEPADMQLFIDEVDASLRSRNVYYDDLITGNILQKLVVRKIEKNGFINYMRSIGKLGGQNKVPRLSNDRNIATALEPFVKQ